MPFFIPNKKFSNNFSKILNDYPITPYLDSRESFIKLDLSRKPFWGFFLEGSWNHGLFHIEPREPRYLCWPQYLPREGSGNLEWYWRQVFNLSATYGGRSSAYQLLGLVPSSTCWPAICLIPVLTSAGYQEAASFRFGLYRWAESCLFPAWLIPVDRDLSLSGLTYTGGQRSV